MRFLNRAVFIPLVILASLPLLAADKPKLILQITVDQLRGDLPTRYYDRLGKGGLKYLLDKGVVFTNAHHFHANTETIVGHATLATGAYPSVHGMIGNVWFDRAKGKTIYNIEDPNYSLLTEGGDVDETTEIDPTQKSASTDGRSPQAILSTTFSDELSLMTDGQAKIFSVSIKDRGAVSMAGHVGKAFWFSKASSEFVTSNYYYDKYPTWVEQWNNKKLAQQYSGQSWQLMQPQENYLFGAKDDQEWELDIGGYGRTFPHELGTTENKYFSTLLTVSPMGDELTLDFAKAVVEAEKLGGDEVTDYLSVSFSATDYIGHFFGPSSLEAEDNILRLDRTLANLLSYIDEKVGLDNTLIVFSSDHGAPEAPGYLHSKGIPSGYVTPKSWDTKPAIKSIKRQYGIKGKLIESYAQPYIYLNTDVINNPKIDLLALESDIIKQLVKFEGVSTAISSAALSNGGIADNYLSQTIINNYHPKRSGNIYLIFDPGWFVNDMDGLHVAVTHGSPWSYDTFVPLIFAGFDLKSKTVSRRVHTVDVAPTLSNMAGTNLPSGSSGGTLVDFFD